MNIPLKLGKLEPGEWRGIKVIMKRKYPTLSSVWQIDMYVDGVKKE